MVSRNVITDVPGRVARGREAADFQPTDIETVVVFHFIRKRLYSIVATIYLQVVKFFTQLSVSASMIPMVMSG